MQDAIQEIVRAMGEAALLRRPDGAVQWVNPAFCDLFGGEPDDWRGRDFGAPRAAAPGARRRYEGETQTLRGPRWTEWEETLLPDGRVLSIGRDITDRRAKQEALRGARDQALAARRVGKAFFAAVTHELRTPLNGVLGMASLLEMTGLKPDQAEHVAAIRESGEHLLAMINDVLDAARLEAGALELERSEVDCARLVRQTAELLAPKAFEKGLEIATVIDPAVPALALGDEGRLRQILFNLAGAAVRRTDRGGVVLSVHALPGGGGQGGAVRLAFAVADTGPALSEDARRSIVDPLQLTDETAAAADNAGLGLVVARRLVAAMEGSLETENLPDGGARIAALIALPAAQARPQDGEAFSGVHVIVASADPSLRGALCEQARLLGARAQEADTPAAARAASRAAPGAILLADAGWRTRLKEAIAPAAAAGLLLRGDQRGLIGAMGRTGFDFYLMKPVRMTSLADRLKGRQAEEERPPAPAFAPGGVGVKGARILLAEDNRVNALLTSTMLRAEGCLVDIVANGEEAVAAARRSPYDLVLMDMRMPVMNGLEATRGIRAMGGAFAAMPIVALTANAFEEDRRDCLAAGMNDFATKPIDMEGVAALLQKWTPAAKQANLA